VKRLARAVRNLLRPAEARRDAGEELRFHVEMFVADEMRRGCSAAEARRRARIELGDAEVVGEDLADARPGAVFEGLGRDLRQAARSLRRAPAFSLVSVMLVALGVGASTAIFTLVERVLLRPLPFLEPDRLVRVFETSPQRGVAEVGVARGNLAEWRKRARAFDGLGAASVTGRTLSLTDGSEVVEAAQVTCEYLPLLGVRPRLGRLFAPDECRRATFNSANAPVGPDPVAILGHDLWVRRFGADPAVIGRSVSLERRAFRVIGVMSDGFSMPEPRVQAYIAWELERSLPRDQRYANALARLRPEVSAGVAEAELRGIAARLADETPQTNRDWSIKLVPLHEQTTAAARPVLLLLLAASALLLLIACANLAILSFARGQARAHEAALRLALGAGRSRLLRQGLLEAGLLAGLGGALGAALAAAGIGVLPRLWPDLPRLAELAVDGTALAFAVAASLVSALLAGALPAWRQASTDPRAAFLDGPRASAGRPAQRARDTLVVAEVALTVVLLAGAGLLMRSVAALRGSDPGFDPGGVLVAPVFLDSQQYDSGAKSREYYARLFERLRGLPGVVAVGGATTLPTSTLGPDFERPVWPLERSADATARREASVRMITPGYLEALRIPVVAGRAFSSADAPGAPNVVAVSETLARELWPGENAVGKSLVVDYSSAGTYPYEVVGVFGDVRFRGPRSRPLAEVYFPHAQRSYLILHVAVRTAQGGPPLAPELRRTLLELDPQKPPYGVQPLEDLLGATYLRERRAMQLLVAFAAVASLLSALGVYGLLAYRVRQRDVEIGVRVALGASPARIVSWVAAAGARLVACGALLGVAGAAAGSHLLGGLLFGVTPADPRTAAGVLALLALVAAAATCLPAWRAARVDPAAVLRRG